MSLRVLDTGIHCFAIHYPNMPSKQRLKPRYWGVMKKLACVSLLIRFIPQQNRDSTNSAVSFLVREGLESKKSIIKSRRVHCGDLRELWMSAGSSLNETHFLFICREDGTFRFDYLSQVFDRRAELKQSTHFELRLLRFHDIH